MDNEDYMLQAIEQAKLASDADEVPVGAIVVLDQQIIGRGFNQPIKNHDPSAHAEILALRDAASQMKNYRLTNAVVYVTLEPCAMCIGAMMHARIAHCVFGAFDEKTGAMTTVSNVVEDKSFKHKMTWEGGVLKDECGELLRDFFRARRSKL